MEAGTAMFTAHKWSAKSSRISGLEYQHAAVILCDGIVYCNFSDVGIARASLQPPNSSRAGLLILVVSLSTTKALGGVVGFFHSISVHIRLRL